MIDALVIDTSAVVAVLSGEPWSDRIIETLDRADERWISAATLVEVGIVLEARFGAAGAPAIERFLRDGEVEVVPHDEALTERALDGWRRFGKARHRAALNLGDCFTYALAAERSAPVLCTGDDFGATDLTVLPERPVGKERLGSDRVGDQPVVPEAEVTRTFGADRDRFAVPDDRDAPLSDEELRRFEQ